MRRAICTTARLGARRFSRAASDTHRPIDVSQLAERIASRRRLVGTRQKSAAVLLPLVGPSDALELLLTTRSEHLTAHASQVAFPGGHCEDGDADICSTALREAHEEIGLPPGSVQVLGLLDDLASIGNETIVTPVVGRVEPGLGLHDLTVDDTEVAKAFTLPLALLQDAARWEVRRIPWKGRPGRNFFFECADVSGGPPLWGMSAYFTLMLLGCLPGGAPIELPAPYGTASVPGDTPSEAFGVRPESRLESSWRRVAGGQR